MKRGGPRIAPERVALARTCLENFMSGPAAEAEVSKRFSIGLRAARRAVSAARDEMREESLADRDERRARVRAAIESCVREAIAKGHIRTALGGLQLLVQVDGLAQPGQLTVEHTGLTDGAIVGKKALLDRLAELRARREDEDGDKKAN